MRELVSIIIPVYNCSDYIEEALRSCIEQSYEDIEILCIDDGSSDNSYEIAKKVLTQSERSFNLIHKENGGVASARNVGLQAAKGNYVAFLDGDDVLSPYAIEVLMKAVAAEETDVVVSEFIYSEDSFHFDCVKDPVINGSVDLISRLFVWGGIYRRRAIPTFDETFRTDEDVVFMINLSRYVDKALHIQNKIYGYRNNHGSLTSSKWKTIERVYDCIRLSQRLHDMIFHESDAGFKAKLINRFRTSKNAIFGELKACGEDNKDVLKQIDELRLNWHVVLTAQLSFRDKARELMLLTFPFLDSYMAFTMVYKMRR